MIKQTARRNARTQPARTPTWIGGTRARVTNTRRARTQHLRTPTLIGKLRAYVTNHSSSRTTLQCRLKLRTQMRVNELKHSVLQKRFCSEKRDILSFNEHVCTFRITVRYGK